MWLYTSYTLVCCKDHNRLLCWSDYQVFLFSRKYSQVYFGDFWVVYTQSKVVREKYGPIFLSIEESASVCLLL